jgi:small-conductance mechanosensitive channel
VNELLSRFWRLEVVRIGDQPVQVSQCVVALLIVVVGLWLARRASRLLVRRLLALPGIKPNALVAVEKLVFYVLALVVVAVALQTVNIPISAFAVLGGAVAIGLGFGAQNLFNNFISGLILIIERPIRVGDLIEVESHRGHVQDVGARCTRIRRGDGVDLLVPNSRLLESTVINWTLSDRRIQTSIRVGFAYGSPARRAAEVLEQSVRSHAGVLRDEEVTVLFEQFGDNALLFVVQFWTEMESEDEKQRIESDIRFEIEERCREAGLTMAFPQRDVHLDIVKPLEVRLLTPSTPAPRT